MERGCEPGWKTEERDSGSEEIDSETESVFTWEMDDLDEVIGQSTAQLLSCSQSCRCRHSLESHRNGTGRDAATLWKATITEWDATATPPALPAIKLLLHASRSILSPFYKMYYLAYL